MRAVVACSVLCWSLSGCVSRPSPASALEVTSPVPQEAVPVEPLQAQAEAPPAPEAPPQLSAQPGRAWQISSKRLVAEMPEGQLGASDLAALRLRPLSQGQGLHVVIDDQAPRPLLGHPRVSDLVLEDRELAPGAHAILVFQYAPERAELELQVSQFSVDGSGAPGRWPCLFALPQGTQNGERSSRIEVLPLAIEKSIDLTRLRIRDATGRVTEADVPPGRSEFLHASSSGDFELGLTCFEGSRPAGPAIERVITVNRDLDFEPSPR